MGCVLWRLVEDDKRCSCGGWSRQTLFVGSETTNVVRGQRNDKRCSWAAKRQTLFVGSETTNVVRGQRNDKRCSWAAKRQTLFVGSETTNVVRGQRNDVGSETTNVVRGQRNDKRCGQDNEDGFITVNSFCFPGGVVPDSRASVWESHRCPVNHTIPQSRSYSFFEGQERQDKYPCVLSPRYRNIHHLQNLVYVPAANVRFEISRILTSKTWSLASALPYYVFA